METGVFGLQLLKLSGCGGKEEASDGRGAKAHENFLVNWSLLKASLF